MSKFRLLSARILILSSRAYLLAWETGRRPVVMNGAKVLGHVISERRPSGSESEARHVLGIAAFLPGSALSDGTSSCSPLWLSRSARRPCEPRARCDREVIVLPVSTSKEFSNESVSLRFLTKFPRAQNKKNEPLSRRYGDEGGKHDRENEPSAVAN